MRKIVAPILLLFLANSACSTVYPVKYYVAAREAVDAAKEVESARWAPGLWYKAEEAYRKAKHQYEEQNYKEAVELFQVAQAYAEKAENSSRYQRQKTGEEAP